MFKQERLSLAALGFYFIIDLVFIFLSFYLPYIIRWNIFFDWGIKAYDILTWRGILLPSFEQYCRLYIFWGAVTILFLNSQHLYKNNISLPIFRETIFVLKAVLYSTLVAGLVVFFIKAIGVSRLVFISNFITLCITLSLWRAVKKIIERQFIWKRHKEFNVLIIGTDRIAEELVEEIPKNPYLRLNIIGFLDDDKEEGSIVFSGYQVLGKTTDFEKIVRQHFVDEALITIPHERVKITNLVQLGKQLNISIKVIPDPFELSMEVLDAYRIGNLPVLDYSIKEFHGADLFGKRITDVILAGLGLVLLWPLFIGLGFLVKLADGGSVFYISKRYGKKGNIFNLYKIRSMVQDADSMLEKLKDKNESDGPIFKIKNDPRISKLGRFLRKYSIDELPQLWNVLKGDMSIVGPRPLPLGQIENQDFEQLRRLEIKPGITGLWQIRGRSDISFQRLVKWDIWYINNWSLWLDFSIILKTIPIVLAGKGAY